MQKYGIESSEKLFYQNRCISLSSSAYNVNSTSSFHRLQRSWRHHVSRWSGCNPII